VTFNAVDLGRFELARLAALRTAQLMRGCAPRVVAGWKQTTTARREIAGGKVLRVPDHANRPGM
jgi:DNA-directed RNA polymerase subunit K/omega